jgi:hypothetical protein
LLVISCFFPWAYYPDPQIREEAQRTFTGFYTYENHYGKPGKFLALIAAVSFILKLLPRIWAKRADLFVTGIGIAYAARIYVEYTGTYIGINPEKKYGLFLMLVFILLIFLASLFPDLKLDQKKD